METYGIPGFQDPISSLTHLLGAAVYTVLAIPLLRRGRGDPTRLFLLGVYAFSCVFLLSMSGVYHMLGRGSGGRAVLQRLDHCAIFVLIAGTFTPAHGILFRGFERWLPLLFVWGAAITGVTLKTIFFTGVSDWLGMVLYLALGWTGAVSGAFLYRRFGMHLFRPLLLGGVAYTAGGALEISRWPVLVPGVIGPHELFHCAVLAGIGFHWTFTARFAAGVPAFSQGHLARIARIKN